MLRSVSNDNTDRQRWMSLLARASSDELGEAWSAFKPAPAYRTLRPAEIGLVMVRGRIGGSGAKFNIGEAAVTRCVVHTEDGYTGMSYVLGRDQRRAELAAVFDALLQDPQRHDEIERSLLERLAQSQQQRREAASRKAAATKVEFYTLARGDDD